MIRDEEVIDILFGRFPELIDILILTEGPYSILGNFGLFLKDGICQGRIDEARLNSYFEFLNEMGESNDLEVRNLLVVGILEILTDYEKSVLITREKLRGRALALFEKTLSGWGQ